MSPLASFTGHKFTQDHLVKTRLDLLRPQRAPYPWLGAPETSEPNPDLRAGYSESAYLEGDRKTALLRRYDPKHHSTIESPQSAQGSRTIDFSNLQILITNVPRVNKPGPHALPARSALPAPTLLGGAPAVCVAVFDPAGGPDRTPTIRRNTETAWKRRIDRSGRGSAFASRTFT